MIYFYSSININLGPSKGNYKVYPYGTDLFRTEELCRMYCNSIWPAEHCSQTTHG